MHESTVAPRVISTVGPGPVRGTFPPCKVSPFELELLSSLGYFLHQTSLDKKSFIGILGPCQLLGNFRFRSVFACSIFKTEIGNSKSTLNIELALNVPTCLSVSLDRLQLPNLITS